MLSQDQNLLLSGLSQESQYLLASHSVAVSLPLQTVLYEANIAPRFAYFLRSGIASVVASMTDGETAEVGMIGHEGVVGAIPLLGSSSVPTNCFIQLEATALRIPMPAFQATFRSSEEIRQRVLEYKLLFCRPPLEASIAFAIRFDKVCFNSPCTAVRVRLGSIRCSIFNALY
jgi:CRP-like cAMP-binding protein